MVELYSHQKKALSKLKPGSILVGGVGSGKSITALAYFYNKICMGNYATKAVPIKPRDLYIITTARKRDSLEWDEECLKFGLSKNRDDSVCMIQVTIDSWNNIKKYANVTNAFFIFDEQRVVGSGAWTKTFLKITKVNEWILLSATPGDTWSDYIPVFVANGFYKNRTAFLRQHAIFDRFAKYPKIVRYVNVEKLEYFRKQILVEMTFTRSTKRISRDILVSYDDELYDIAFKKRWNPYTNEPIPDAGQLCHVLRKIVNSNDSRLDEVTNLSWIHDRMIIFYNLNAELEKLRSLKDSSDIPQGTVIAEWNGHKHEPIPKTDRWLYLVQYMAGSEGWNCTKTDTVIFYSLNYSYKIMEQASGRIDRLNTPYSNLYYYRFISDSTIDKSIVNALKNKRNFNELAFVNERDI
jgi:hypothetical protein